jgi:hypothetical protein
VADLERRLTFYRWRDPDDPPTFDRLQAARLLAGLPDDASRKCPRGDYAADVLLKEAGTADRPTKVVVLRLRGYENRPYVRRPGEAMSPVTMARDADLVDAAHGLIWGDGRAAFAQGGYAPPPGYLSDFLLVRTGQHVVFDPLFDRSLVQRLRQLTGIRAVELRIRSSRAVQDLQDAQLGPILGLFRRYQGQPQEVVLSETIRVASRGKGARQAVLATLPVADVIAMSARADEIYDTFRVTGLAPNGRTEYIDLINERLHVVKRIARSRRGGNYTDDNATFAALAAARDELEADGRLQQAATSQAD